MSGLNVPVDWRMIAADLSSQLGMKQLEIAIKDGKIAALEAELVKLYSETAADGEGSDAD